MSLGKDALVESLLICVARVSGIHGLVILVCYVVRWDVDLINLRDQILKFSLRTHRRYADSMPNIETLRMPSSMDIMMH